MPIPALYASLNALTHAGILHWEHQESSTQITWLMARAAEGYLPISRKKIQDLRTSKGHRANAMLGLLHGPGCRMRHILDYFGEKDYPECGCCDRCTQSQSRGRMALLAHILTLLQEKSSSARELKFALPDAPQDIDSGTSRGNSTTFVGAIHAWNLSHSMSTARVVFFWNPGFRFGDTHGDFADSWNSGGRSSDGPR